MLIPETDFSLLVGDVATEQPHGVGHVDLVGWSSLGILSSLGRTRPSLCSPLGGGGGPSYGPVKKHPSPSWFGREVRGHDSTTRTGSGEHGVVQRGGHLTPSD